MRDLRTLPKAHLHLHLEAAMRADTLADLATQKGLTVPTIGSYGSFAAFSATYDLATHVLQTRDDWARLADEVLADAAAEGCAYVEPAFWAERYRDRFGTDHDTWAMVLDLFGEAAERHGVGIGWIAAIDRVVDDQAAALAVAELAVELAPRGVVGIGLHNDEVGHPPTDFVRPFAVARDGGLLSAPHAGELDEGRHVRDAVEQLGADRIAHGVRSFEVDGLVDQLVDQGITLDVCPTSNLLLGIVPDLASHPLPALLDAGVRCTVNADDPILFDATILGEYELCREVFGFDDDRLAAIARVSIEDAGMPDATKAPVVAAIDAWLAG